MLLPGAASAGNTRLIYYGSGPLDAPDYASNNKLTFTPASGTVSGGGSVATNIIVKNIDNQTLNHVVTSASLPAGWTFAVLSNAVNFDPATACTGVLTNSLTCDFGQLASSAMRSYQLVIQTAANSGTTNVAVGLDFRVTFNESGNPNGSNSHNDAATGTLTITPTSCDSVTTYTYGNGNHSVSTCSLSDPKNLNGQTSKVTFPNRLNVVQLSESDDTSLPPCPPKVTCIGHAIVANIDGDTSDDIVVWEVSIAGVTVGANKISFYHYNDAGTLVPAGGILNSNKNLCTAAKQKDCWEAGASVIGGVFHGIVHTGGNGVGRFG